MNKKWWTGALALLIIAIGIFIYLYFFHGNTDPMLADKGSGISSNNSSTSTNTNTTNTTTSTNSSSSGNNTSFSQNSNNSTNTGSNNTSTNYSNSNNQSSTGSQGNIGQQTPAKFDTEAPSTYLIFGRDRSINEDTGETDEQVIETDMVLVVTLDPKARSVHASFIPPNTAVGGSDELKSLYNEKGVSGLIAGVEEVTDTQIDFYIGVDYEPFIQLVDVLKGLEVRMDETIELTKYGLLIHPGINKLNGEETLKLLRLKRGSTTIFERIERQKQVLNALYQRISNIRNLSQLQDFSQALLTIREKVETDISSDQILQGIKFFGMGIKSFNVDILSGELVEGLWIPRG